MSDTSRVTLTANPVISHLNELDRDYDKRNIDVVTCDTNIP